MGAHSSQFLFATTAVVLRGIYGVSPLDTELPIALREFVYSSASRNKKRGYNKCKYNNG